MPAFDVTPSGFTTPRLADARARVIEIWRARFGENADTSSDSPDGKIIDTFSLLLALVWQGLGQLNADAYARTAEGVFLDQSLDMFARRRLPAAPSTVPLIFYGADSTAVIQGSLVATTDTLARFGTDEAVTIGDDNSVWVVVVDSIEDSTLYRVTINATDYDFTSDGSATADEVLAGILDALEGAPGITAIAGGLDSNGDRLIVIDTPAAATLAVTGPLVRYYAARVGSTATETGPIQGLTGTVRVLVNPIAGVTGVTSTEDADVGRNLETDGEFFARHLRTLSANASRSPEAIAARLMEPRTGVPGVVVARVRENETSVDPDANGLPAHSFETLVLGGDDQAIADLIWAQKPAGIRAYGTTEVAVLDSVGHPHTIGFTRPTVRYLHLEITVTPGEGYPMTGTPLATIQDAVATFFRPGGAGELQLGQDFYRFAVGRPASEVVHGIAALAVRTSTTAAPEDAPTFAASDVSVDDDEILDVDSARITMI